MINSFFKKMSWIFLLVLLITFPASAESTDKLDESQTISQKQAKHPIEVSAKGKVLSVSSKGIISDPLSGNPVDSYKVKVRIINGEFKGREIYVTHNEVDNPMFNIEVKPRDTVTLEVVLENGEPREAYITGLVRENHLYTLGIIFIILLLGIGWKKGLKSLCSLVLTLVLIWGVLIPGLLKEYSPVLLTGLISLASTAITLLVVGGFTRKSIAAILGTISGVTIAGAAAFITGKLARLTGFGTEEAAMLLYLPDNIKLDIQGILFAGIIIGALGASMDVSMSIASAIAEIKQTDPGLSIRQLIRSGMNVGQDIIGTMANTLILAYTGSSVQLILVFAAFQESFTKIINLDMVASEVVRALSGSIGMIAIIPLTAVIAGILFGNRERTVKEEPKNEGYWEGWGEGK